jgi:hypothetical protein
VLAASVSFDHAAGEHRQVRRVKRTGISDVRSAEVSVGSKGLPDNEGMISDQYFFALVRAAKPAEVSGFLLTEKLST